MSLGDQLKALSTRYELLAVYAFGSRATEIARCIRGQTVSPEFPESDIDIGVQPAPDRRLTAQERVRLAVELEELLGAKRVDLVVLPEADPFLALDVIRGELLYCADADAQAEDELYVLRRAGDLARFARERWRLILSGTTP
jgi:predicted nucleotidyltransferase